MAPLSIYQEYGVTKDEVDRAAKNILRQVEQERKTGKLKPWKGGSGRRVVTKKPAPESSAGL
ncbi:MAG: hypothetical protein WCO56_18015 [Verrucomicrobiota bacterium]